MSRLVSDSCLGSGVGVWVRGIAVTAALVLWPAEARPGNAESGLRVERTDTTVSVLAGDRLCARYRFAGVTHKPYVDKLLTPAGTSVLRDAPHDHLHHHALMFAIAVDGVNFWEERPASGREVPRGAIRTALDQVRGWDCVRLGQALDWIASPGDQLLLREERTIEVFVAADLEASLLTWQARLTVPAGRTSATLSGSPYFGLGVRFLESMDDGGHFQNADGATGVSGTNDVRSAWCAYQAVADGKTVTFAMFDHPDNVRYPATWYTMGDKPGEFVYMTNTLNLKREPLAISSDQPLVLRYGVALWDGRADAARVGELYRRWAALPATASAPL